MKHKNEPYVLYRGSAQSATNGEMANVDTASYRIREYSHAPFAIHPLRRRIHVVDLNCIHSVSQNTGKGDTDFHIAPAKNENRKKKTGNQPP